MVGGVIALAIVLTPVEPFKTAANFSWFIGAGVGALVYYLNSRSSRVANLADKEINSYAHVPGATAGERA